MPREEVNRVHRRDARELTRAGELIRLLVTTNDKLPDLCGNRLLQNDFMKKFCEIKVYHSSRSTASGGATPENSHASESVTVSPAGTSTDEPGAGWKLERARAQVY